MWLWTFCVELVGPEKQARGAQKMQDRSWEIEKSKDQRQEVENRMWQIEDREYNGCMTDDSQPSNKFCVSPAAATFTKADGFLWRFGIALVDWSFVFSSCRHSKAWSLQVHGRNYFPPLGASLS